MSDSPIIVTATADAITDAAGKTLAQTSAEVDAQIGHSATPATSTETSAPSAARVYSRNVLINVARIAVFGAVGVMLPAFLTHRLPIEEYGAWILILQVAGYIGYLDFGIQIAVSKYIAEYDAAGDVEGCGQHASAGVAVTLGTATLGLILSIVISLLIPRIFPSMPPALAADVGRGVLLVGISTAVQLGSSAFAGIFIGLQRYAVPTFNDIVSKIVYAVVIIVMVAHHSTLTAMGLGVAVINIGSAIFQVVAWRLYAHQIPVSPRYVVWPVVKRMLTYCSVLGIWTAGMLIITGLDTTIVGRVEFAETAFYAVAATPITFLSMCLHAGLSPLMPAASAMSVTRTATQMGQLLARTTRYAFLILQMSGLPLILFGYYVLLFWVGPAYARHGLILLRILVLAHIVRNLCAPYATMVIATGMQKVATWAGVCEAVTNLGTSLVLGKLYGAVGVASGTLIGAVVGVVVHYTLSMRRTQGILAISPLRLLRQGVLRPSLSLLPTLLLLPIFWKPVPVHLAALYLMAWLITSVILFWQADLTRQERASIVPRLRGPLRI